MIKSPDINRLKYFNILPNDYETLINQKYRVFWIRLFRQRMNEFRVISSVLSDVPL